MGKVDPYWRAELTLPTIKLVFKKEKVVGVVEPFCAYQIKSAVSRNDVEWK